MTDIDLIAQQSSLISGMKKADFKIDVDDDMLTISAEKEEEKDDSGKKFTRKEYSYSSFRRSFTIPAETKVDKIDARYVDGILKLVLSKTEETRKSAAKHIAVK